jgi:GT2 family glycosyltransferase
MKLAFIIPLHNGPTLLRRCLESILLHTPPTDFSIVLVDDGSTDPVIGDLCQMLVGFSTQDVTYIHNDTPQGFSRACNQGIAAASDCTHYVIVNTDTEIGTPDWTVSLDKLSHEYPDIGLFGPVSNNAGSQSVPTQYGDELPKGETVPSFTKLVTAITERRFPPMILVHGFFYIVRKDVITDVGDFDESTFPYFGAENDLSLRAAQTGWRGVTLDDIFVHHTGAVSHYSPPGQPTLVGDSLQTLVGKYGEDYAAALSQQGGVGLEYMRVAMVEHYRKVQGMPRRVQ